jgi:DNA-binding NtrC family response regulator
LSVLPISIPPLRERRADIVPAAEHFAASLAIIHNRAPVQLTEAVRRVFTAYAWPGNLRELRNAVERAMVFSRSAELQLEDLPEGIRAAAGGAAFLAGLRSLEDLERDAIAQTLEATRYHITKSAEVLGISRKTLLEKRKKYGMQ